MGSDAPTCSGSVDGSQARGAAGHPWRGALRAFKVQKTDDKLHEQYKHLSSEVQMYVSMTASAGDHQQQSPLSWWAKHLPSPSDTASSLSGSGGEHPLPVVSRLAAQYGALSPCSLQANPLFGDATARFQELVQQQPWPTVQAMLYLRLNRNMLASMD